MAPAVPIVIGYSLQQFFNATQNSPNQSNNLISHPQGSDSDSAGPRYQVSTLAATDAKDLSIPRNIVLWIAILIGLGALCLIVSCFTYGRNNRRARAIEGEEERIGEWVYEMGEIDNRVLVYGGDGVPVNSVHAEVECKVTEEKRAKVPLH